MSLTSTSSASLLVYEFQPTTPANTASSSPYTADMIFPPLEVDIIEWMVPTGPQGNLGWQLMYNNALVIPQNGTWIITDGEFGRWEIDELPTAGSWGFQGYNSDTVNDHTVYLRFLVSPIAQIAANSAMTVIPNWPFGGV
jgi:hypothetical protein